MLWDPRYSLVPGLGRIDTQPGSDYFYPGPHKIPENLPSWERNPTTLGNADFLSGAVPAHGLIPPPPFLGSSEAFPVHGTWNAYTPLPATTHSCRKIEPPPPTRDATQTWPYILVGWCPPSPAGYWTPPRRSHTDLDCGCAYAHFVTQRRLDPKCHWLLVQPLCHEAAPTIGAEY